MPPVAPPPSASTSSLIALHTVLVSEQAVLEQLLYKNRNQHRHANYYQFLHQVARHHRHIDLLALVEEMHPPTASPSPSSFPPSSTPPSLSPPSLLLPTIERLRRCLCAILHAAEPLYVLLHQTYFMPLALTSLALLARLLVVVKSALLLLMTAAKEREERDRGGKRVFSAPRSVGAHLLAALQQPKGELVVAEFIGVDLDERWQTVKASTMSSVATSVPPVPTASSKSVDEEDIPFFDVEPITPAPSLPLTRPSVQPIHLPPVISHPSPTTSSTPSPPQSPVFRQSPRSALTPSSPLSPSSDWSEVEEQTVDEAEEDRPVIGKEMQQEDVALLAVKAERPMLSAQRSPEPIRQRALGGGRQEGEGKGRSGGRGRGSPAEVHPSPVSQPPALMLGSVSPHSLLSKRKAPPPQSQHSPSAHLPRSPAVAISPLPPPLSRNVPLTKPRTSGAMVDGSGGAKKKTKRKAQAGAVDEIDAIFDM